MKTPKEFFADVAGIIEEARRFVGRTADLTMCVTYFEIGRMIVEEEQGGKARAEYGRGLLKELSAFLCERFGKGFSVGHLRNARQFFQAYAPSISQTMFAKLENGEIRQKRQSTTALFDEENQPPIHQSMISELSKSSKNQLVMTDDSSKNQSLTDLFRVSWTHYLVLMRIKNPDERRFYEIEAAKQNWTVRQLQRQYGSSLYERLALSRKQTEWIEEFEENRRLQKSQQKTKI